MTKTTWFLAPVVLAGAVLAGAADASAGTTLDLWSGPYETGESQRVEVPAEGGCVELAVPITARSARNSSGEFNATLYARSGCTGKPAAVVNEVGIANFTQQRVVRSVMFTGG